MCNNIINMKNPWDINNNKENKEKINTNETNEGIEKKIQINEEEIEKIAKDIFNGIHKNSKTSDKNSTDNQNNKEANTKNDKKNISSNLQNNIINNINKIFDIDEKKLLKIIILIFIVVWCLSGLYKVNSNENAVITYFGKYYNTTTPGLHYAIPYPIGKVIKVSTTRINKEEFGFSTTSYNKRHSDEESLMLTGDENIADIDFEVQWQISDVKNYLFNIKNQQQTIRNTTESVMREIIATKEINDILANKKLEIELEAKKLLQDILDSYSSGIKILSIQLLRADPPKEVIDAFRDVQTAKADKERKINEAEAYSNDVLPKARGEAEAIIQNAEAYKKEVILKAEGEATRFNKIYNEYKKNPDIIKKRIYLETMEEILSNNNKTIIDSKIKNIMPLLQNNK